MHTFNENVKTDIEYAGGTLNNSATTPIYFSMKNYDRIAFLIQTGTLTSTASLSIQGRQRIGASGTESNLGSAVTYTTDDGIKVVEFQASQLTMADGNDRVGLLITETGTQNAVVKAVIACRFQARFPQATLGS
jgi:hypothetical protein